MAATFSRENSPANRMLNGAMRERLFGVTRAARWRRWLQRDALKQQCHCPDCFLLQRSEGNFLPSTAQTRPHNQQVTW